MPDPKNKIKHKKKKNLSFLFKILKNWAHWSFEGILNQANFKKEDIKITERLN